MVSGNLEFNGPGIEVDSFDSSIPGENINGQYDPSVAGDGGTVYAGETSSNSVSLGSAHVYSFVYTGPGAAVSIGPTGAVGTHFWQASDGTGFEPGFSFTEGFAPTDVTVPVGLSYMQPGSGQLVTEDGPATSQPFTNEMNLPTLSSNQTLVSITTNTANITTTTYPGPLPGLVTNISSITTSSYPGDVPGLSTNCVWFVTVTNDPGPQPCLSVVQVGSVTTADYPGPIYGLVTNTIIAPPCISPITNFVCSDSIISSTLPDSWCAANGIQTNCGTITTTTPPVPGTVCPGTEIITNYNGSKRVITGYTYSMFEGYTYTTNTTSEIVTYSTNYDCPSATNYTYTYPATNYFTYADQLSYTYQIMTYTYPIFTYNYTIYTPWTYETNYYDNILSGGNYFSSNALVGSTIVTGPSTLVMSNFGGNIAVAPGGSLTVYVQSGSCSININQITNQTGLASNLVVLCSPDVSSLTVSGMGSFAGIVYAPEAYANVYGGAVGLDYSGSLGANSLTALGDFRMHYDAALARSELDFTVFYVPPPPPMTLYPLGITTNGQFQFFGAARSGYNWVVETSTDLVNWTSVMTNPAFGVFTDTNGISAGQCFYRTFYIP